MGKSKNVELEKMQLEQDVMGFNLNTLLNYLNAARTKTLCTVLYSKLSFFQAEGKACGFEWS